MKLAGRTAQIRESCTMKLALLADRLKGSGRPVIHLGVGEPIETAPLAAVGAAGKLLESRVVRYTPAGGTGDLRAAAAAYAERTRDVVGAGPDNVMVSNGGKQALMTALLALLDGGDEVLVPVPYWVSYPEMVRLAGGTPVLAASSEGAVFPSVADLEQLCSDKTRALILNSPNNPSGDVLTEEKLRELVSFCDRKGIWLLMDDIYHRLVFRGYRVPSAHAVAGCPVDDARIVVVDGVSKSHAMTGFRMGWAVGPSRLISAMVSLQGHISSGPGTLSQAAALAALEGGEAEVEAMRASLEKKAVRAAGELRRLKGVTVDDPRGAFYLFPDFSSIEPDSTRLAERLLQEAHVATVPGAAFGVEGHIRFSFCGEEEAFAEAVNRIASLIS